MNIANNRSYSITQEHRTRLYQILGDLDNDQLRFVLTNHSQNPSILSKIQHYTHAQLLQQCLLLVDNYHSLELEQTLYNLTQKRTSMDFYHHYQQQQQQQQPFYYPQQPIRYNAPPAYHFPPGTTVSQQQQHQQQIRPIRPHTTPSQPAPSRTPRPQSQQPAPSRTPHPQLQQSAPSRTPYSQPQQPTLSRALRPQPQQPSYNTLLASFPQPTRHSTPSATLIPQNSSRPKVQRYQVPLLSSSSSTSSIPSLSTSQPPPPPPILPSTNPPQRDPTTKIAHKPLPFYHTISCIYERYNIFHFDTHRRQYISHDEFILPLDICNELALSYDYDPSLDTHKTGKCLLLRLIRTDQPAAFNGKYEDNLPVNLAIHVNGHILTNLPTPKPSTRQQKDLIRNGREIDITSYSMFNPILKNEITITWSYRPDNTSLCIQYTNAEYALHIFLVEHLTVKELCEEVMRKPKKFYREDLVNLLAKARANDRDLGLEVSDQILKLTCPIDKKRLKIPARAVTCQHLQCFDLTNYLALNEKSNKWICPVCNKPALFDDLQVDSYTDSIIHSIQNENITEITINGELHWIPALQVNLGNESNDSKSNIKLFSSTSSTDVIFIDDDD